VESGPVASLGLTFLSARLTPELLDKYVTLLKEEVGRVAPNLNPLDRRLTAPGRA
jgi:hypothetical protein